MSTPCTLMRCRMKDLISCFKACKVPIEEDDNESNYQNPKASSIDHQEGRREKAVVELGRTAEIGSGGEESPTSWQSCESEEDEYIVFYFRDADADVDVIEKRGLENSNCRKQDAIPADRRKKHETREIEVDSKSIPTKSDHINEWSEHESQEYKDTMGESSDSSTSSFAFPTIQSEWTGSPVLMPRPEGHNKTRSVCIQCCKF
ncbi:hypothetical protein L1887_16559 [Cichorium endivia]|nr:hypothetical protein L1887_16559 [Cichorium endivia]